MEKLANRVLDKYLGPRQGAPGTGRPLSEIEQLDTYRRMTAQGFGKLLQQHGRERVGEYVAEMEKLGKRLGL